ncbi:MAG: efflux RND transporter periplasmic adaptor subunit [Rickettsiales bacterium]|nr:efflux RND transporter periplasmic adaptor subunit [Rickettsiales bacterium]
MQTPVALTPLRKQLSIEVGPVRADGSPSWTIHDTLNNRYFRIGWLEHEFLKHWHLGNTQKILEAVEGKTSLAVEMPQLKKFIEFLEKQQLLESSIEALDRQFKATRKRSLPEKIQAIVMIVLFYKYPLFRADNFIERTLPYVSWLYSKTMLRVIAGGLLLSLFLIARDWTELRQPVSYLFTYEGATLLFISLLFTQTVHELGHAYTAKYFGVRVPSIGVGLFFLVPMLYTDVNGAWRLPSRSQRLSIGAAGILVEMGLAMIASLLWVVLDDGVGRSIAFMVATSAWVSTVVINLNPFIRFDGYFLLADLLGIDGLQERSYAWARWCMRRVLLGVTLGQPDASTPILARFLTVFGFITWIFRVSLFLSITLAIYHFFFKALGVVLLVVQVIVFCVPLVKEVKLWWSLRKQWRAGRETILAWCFVSVMLALLLVPWQTSLAIPALLKAEDEADFYPSQPARIGRIHVHNLQFIKQGEVLFELESPRLEQEYQQLLLEKKKISFQIHSVASASQWRGRLLAMIEQKAAIETRLDSVQKQHAALTILAPFSGIVLDVDTALSQGIWVNPSQLLGRMVSEGGKVIALAGELDRQRLMIGAHGNFVGENSFTPIATNLKSVNVSILRELPWGVLSSFSGGAIPVKPDKEGLKIEGSYYMLNLQANGTLTPSSQMRGTLHLQAESVSPMMTFLRRIESLFIRETGF